MNCKSVYATLFLVALGALAMAGYFIAPEWYLGMVPVGVWFLANIAINKDCNTEEQPV